MTPLEIVRKKKIFRYISAFLAVNMLVEYVQPMKAFALTSGPGQEEFASFEPVSTSDMVDLYTGDFNYNIPLMSVPGPNGGYPINIAYHSGVGMDQEASWVGLGWNISVGAINRQMRGLPDDFNGDAVINKYSMRDNTTVGIGFDATYDYTEYLGVPTNTPFNPIGGPQVQFQLYYNTYRGVGYRIGYSGLSWPMSTGSVGAGLHFDSQGGIGVEPNFSLGWSAKHRNFGMGFSSGMSINSREGLSGFSFALSAHGRQSRPHWQNSNRKFLGYSATSNLSFGIDQNVPTATIPYTNSAYAFDIRGGEAGKFASLHNIMGAFESGMPYLWSGFLNVSGLSEQEVTSGAYGYLYDYNSTDAAIRDFNRDQFTYNKKIPNLPSSVVTHDIYMTSGQGIGGCFRPVHQSVKIFSPQQRENPTLVARLNIELGLDNYPGVGLDEYHIGLGASVGVGGNVSGSWDNIYSSDVRFADDFNLYEVSGDPGYELSPFKMFGEKTAMLIADEDHLAAWDNSNAVRVELEKETSEDTWLNAHFEATTTYSDGTAGYTPVSFVSDDLQLHSAQRERRATDIEYYTAAQCNDYGFTHYTGYDTAFDLGLEKYVLENIEKAYPDYGSTHHISEISILKPDGMRYTYGLSAYNREQSDNYFSYDASATGSTFNTPIIEAEIPNSDDMVDPSGTPDNFVSETQLPAYTHSWLLTSVVSADYLDLTGDGPSDDDYGYWVRFNYSKTSEDYTWRTPYYGATFIAGNASDVNDDKGSFSYGKKEVYFIQSIETKTHIATFSVSKREDALAANNKFEGGQPGTPTDAQRMFKLDHVDLYTKAEYFENIEDRVMRPAPTPIQSANFRYSYDLCPGALNNTGADMDVFGNTVSGGDPSNINSAGGKLTLDTLFFTYQTSERGKYSPYIFEYDNSNPDYDKKNMDRWGHYKDNDAYETGGYYPYVDFPYTEQDAAPDAGTWSLSRIELPTGATMEIEYESDDYQYVEGKKAQRMYDIVGTWGDIYPSENFATNRNTSPKTTNLEYSAESDEYKLYFKLEDTYASASLPNEEDFYEKYLDGGRLDTVFFKAYLDIKGWNGNYYDWVTGYARISTDQADCGLESSNGGSTYDVGYVTLLGEDLDRYAAILPKVHPFIRAGIEHLHYNRPDIANTPVPQTADPFDQVTNFISSVPGMANDVVSMLAGYNNWAYLKGSSKKMRLNGWSTIRLQDPDKKYGGGDRVSQLSLTDNWANDETATNTYGEFSYGQKYSYLLEDGTSSGVAYEPQIGGDESALRSPRPYEHSVPVKGTEHLYIENPIMESYYPGAQVGYSRVTVQSIAPDRAFSESAGTNELKFTATPLSIYEFYTPRDFPVLVDETPITADPSIIRPIIIPGIYTNFKKYAARSQGYSVVLNDMAGKLKSVEIRTRPSDTNPTGNLLSRQRFVYNTEQPYSEDVVNKLSSMVQVMSCDGDQVQYQTAVVGQSHDIFVDMNENREWMTTVGLDVNLDLQFTSTGIPTFIFIMPLVNVARNDVRQRTVVVNKIIHRSGILKEVITTDHESTVKSSYIAFDQETGEPLLTQIENEFNDTLYNMTYPGHWYYPAMRGAYQNFGVEFSASTAGGSFPIPVDPDGRIVVDASIPVGRTVNDYFMEGDQVWVVPFGDDGAIYTVIKVGDDAGDQYIDLIDQAGNFIDDALSVESIRVIKSGYQNLQVLAAGAVTAKHMLVWSYDPNNSDYEYDTPQNFNLGTDSAIINASAVEYADIWQTPCKDCEGVTMPNGTTNPFRWGVRGKWRPLQSYAFVTQRTQNDDIAEDGVYTLFEQFDWLDPSSSNAAWTAATTVTKYSPNGFELENRDALGNYSAALFEFGESVVTAIASNARHKEIAFDSFEDYDFMASCQLQYDHWGFDPSDIERSDDQYHTGTFSLKVSEATGTEVITRTLINKNCETYRAVAKRVGPLVDGDASVEYEMDTCDCVGKFSPIIGKQYVLSAWVKETGNATPPLNYTNAKIKVEVLNSLAAVIETETFSPSGPIIEGWQRVFGTFDVPVGAYQVRVTYINNTSTGEDCFYDDTRIHPFDANMVTYVYDPFSFRRVAELDANNFATFYVYDEEGQLTAIKKETSGGIKTLREGKTVLKPSY